MVRLCLIAATLTCAMLVFAQGASAAPFVVDDLDDANDTTINGTCDADGPDTCTLRAALGEADSNATDDNITFSVSGTHVLTMGPLGSGSANNVTITGNGQSGGGTTIDANDASRAFSISGTGATIEDLRIRDGRVTDINGGGIDSGADLLTLNHVTITSNTVNSVSGGSGGAGINTATSAELVLNDSSVSDNTITGTAGSGGGIRANGPLTLNRSTVSGNKATELVSGQAGGLQLSAPDSFVISNSTISDNQSGSGNGGGGILATGATDLTVANSTIAGNSTLGDGGGIKSSGAVSATNTIVADNSADVGSPNCGVIFSSAENNIDSPGNSCGFGTSDGNQENVSAAALGLNALAGNGGPTQTRGLSEGSVAIDAGDNGTCGAAPVSGVDQRGVTRPQRPTCDVGAVEFDPPQTTITSGPAEGSTTSDTTPTFGFSSSESSTFQCKVDGGSFANCSSPKTTSSLSDGSHTFQVRAKDLAGNNDPTPASRTFTVDTTPPNTTIGSGPAQGSTISDPAPTFSFSSEAGATFECRVDGASFSSCTSPQTTSSLSDGSHTFQVRATDAVANVEASPASRTFTVDTSVPPPPAGDTTAPDTEITKGPKKKVKTRKKKAKVKFEFSSEANASFECALDDAAFESCSSPFKAKVKKGKHSFAVRAKDAAGNVDQSPDEQTFKVKRKKK
jgi:hypothetical protein